MNIASNEPAATNPVSPSPEGRREGVRSPPTSHYVWYVIIVLTIVGIFKAMDERAISVLLPAIKADMALSDSELGFLGGLAFSVFFAICGIPIARLADRGSRRNIIALALAAWSLMTALTGAAQNYLQLLLARIGVGAGEAGAGPAAQSLICDYVPYERRPSVFAIQAAGGAIGAMLGTALAGWLAEIVGWRWTFMALGLPGIALALTIMLTLREPARVFTNNAQAAATARFLPALSALMKSRTYVLLVVCAVLWSSALGGISLWLPSFYTRVFGLSLSSAGFYVALSGVLPLIAILVGGGVANHLARHDARLPLTVGAVLFALTVPAYAVALLAPTVFVSLAFVSLASILSSLPVGTVIATYTSAVPAFLRATGSAVLLLTTMLSGFGPLFVGLLADALAASMGDNSLRYALLITLCFIPPAAWAMWRATRTLPQDLERAESEVT